MKKYKGRHELAREVELTEKAGETAEEATRETARKKPKKKSRKRLWISLGVVVLTLCLLVGGAYGAFSHYMGKLNYVPREEDQVEAEVTPAPLEGLTAEETAKLDEQLEASLAELADWDYTAKDVTNILLIGVDNDYAAGMGERGNADGLILVSINKDTNQLVLTSFMRDIYVPVREKGYNTKLTMTYHYGGTQTLLDVIEKNFGIPIDNYILVNYLNVVDIVDAVGGLTFEPNRAELYYMLDKIENLNRLTGQPLDANKIDPDTKGPITFNGIQTAAYMRIRYAGNGDYDRTERAREVLFALKDKALAMNFAELNGLANTVLPKVTTDLEQGEILALLLNAASYMKYDMVSSRIPAEDTFYGADIAGSVIVVDFKANADYLYKTIYEGVQP